MEKYFESPRQVSFYNAANECWEFGIAYQDVIICAECGCEIYIEDIYDEAPEGIEPIAVYDNWASFADVIRNGTI